MFKGWLGGPLVLGAVAIAFSVMAVEPREVDPNRIEDNRADQSPARIDQNRVDPARANDRRVDEGRVSDRQTEQPGEPENASRRDDPMARNNLDRDDTSDGVYPLELDYSAALARCERLSEPDRTQCVTATNVNFGRM